MGNVYMEAEQVRFKDSTYHNLQTAVSAALEGGGGGGTTVVANPEGSATADLAKLQVGTTIYGIPAEAGDISYDNTSSGMTADDVQEAIDELNTGIGGISDLIPADATSSNKLATADDIPDAVTGNPTGTATAGNLTKIQIGSDIYNIPSGGANYVDTDWISLNSLTWDGGTGGTLYYAVVANVIPADKTLVCAFIASWDQIRGTDNLFITATSTSSRNVAIAASTNTFLTNAAIKLRLCYV